MLFDETVDFDDRKEIYTHLSSIAISAEWLFTCANTPEETKVLFDAVLALIDTKRVKKEAAFKEDEVQKQLGLEEFKAVKEEGEVLPF